MPTMLAPAGADVPEGHELDGVNLLPVLLKRQSLGPRKLFWSYGRQQAMRDGPWKLVISQPKGEPPSNAPPPELFHLADDLGEEHNLGDEHPERVQTMQEAIRAWQTDVEAGATRQPDLPKQPGPDDSQSS